jgi:hypothetical protein
MLINCTFIHQLELKVQEALMAPQWEHSIRALSIEAVEIYHL